MNERVSERWVWLYCAAPRRSFVPFRCRWWNGMCVCVRVCGCLGFVYKSLLLHTHTHTPISEWLDVGLWLSVPLLNMHHWTALCCTWITKLLLPFLRFFFINSSLDFHCFLQNNYQASQANCIRRFVINQTIYFYLLEFMNLAQIEFQLIQIENTRCDLVFSLNGRKCRLWIIYIIYALTLLAYNEHMRTPIHTQRMIALFTSELSTDSLIYLFIYCFPFDSFVSLLLLLLVFLLLFYTLPCFVFSINWTLNNNWNERK